MDDNVKQLIYDLYVRRNMKLREVREILLANYGNRPGFSIANIERYIRKWEFNKRETITNGSRNIVGEAVCRVGGSAGGKFVQAYMEGNMNVRIGRRRVYNSLQEVDPTNYALRRQSARVHFNPKTYHAPYFGYNLHMDQNEKMGMYGVCFVIAIDGKSFMILAAAEMPVKNNLTIYDKVYRKAVENYGLWQRVIVDHGTEFYLSLDMHQKLHTVMGNVNYDDRQQTVRQVPSPRNNRIERLWVDVNRIVIYPLKTAIRQLEFEQRIDCTLQHHLFSISQVLLRVSKVALEGFVRMWNAHNIQGKGRPADHVQFSRTLPMDPNFLLPVADAVAQYPGQLTDPHQFGRDILTGYEEAIQERDNAFEREFLPRFFEDIVQRYDLQNVNYENCYDMLYGTACNHLYLPLQAAVLKHISLSEFFFNRL